MYDASRALVGLFCLLKVFYSPSTSFAVWSFLVCLYAQKCSVFVDAANVHMMYATTEHKLNRHYEKSSKTKSKKSTSSGGSLGSWVDEERS